jgi:hypothetical protein
MRRTLCRETYRSVITRFRISTHDLNNNVWWKKMQSHVLFMFRYVRIRWNYIQVNKYQLFSTLRTWSDILICLGNSVSTPRARRTGWHIIQSSTFDLSWEPLFLHPAPIESANTLFNPQNLICHGNHCFYAPHQ